MKLFDEESREKSKVNNYYGQTGFTIDRPIFTHHSDYEGSTFTFILKDNIASDINTIYKRNYKLKGIKCLSDKQYNLIILL